MCIRDRYRPAKYLRGSYILEDTYYVYIKRQPLNALINQEKLNEKGIDGMGSIIYKKLKHDLTNENLQEILACLLYTSYYIAVEDINKDKVLEIPIVAGSSSCLLYTS